MKAERGRKRWPQELPVIEQVVDSEEVKVVPDQWRCIGEEVSEQLDYEPARFLRRRLVRLPACWRRLSLANFAIIFHFTGRNKFIGPGTGSGCRGKTWLIGWT